MANEPILFYGLEALAASGLNRAAMKPRACNLMLGDRSPVGLV